MGARQDWQYLPQ